MNKPQQKPEVRTPSLSFVDYLEANLREAPPRQKGARTRERLKIATAKMLDAKGYHAMRVVDITESAGVAEGSFYVYFTDKKDATLTALSAFIIEFVDLVAPPEAVHTSFESIRAANRRWFALCRANAGLFRCIYQLGDEDADFASLVQRVTRQWYLRVTHNVRLDRRGADGTAILLAIYFMGSMMDEIKRKLIIFPDQEFHKLLRSLDADDDAIADAASLIWMRIFDSNIKLPDDLPPAAAQLARLIWP